MNWTSADLSQAPMDDWQDDLCNSQDDPGPSLPEEHPILTPWMLETNHPVEPLMLTAAPETNGNSTALALIELQNPVVTPEKNTPKTFDNIEMQLAKLAKTLGTPTLVCAKDPEMTSTLDKLQVSDKENDVMDVEFDALMSYSRKLMMGATNEKSRKVYDRYQKMYLTYLTLYSLDPLNPQSPQTFFVVLHHKYSGSSLWTIYSCVNSWYKATHGFDLKTMPMVTALMKTVTANHVIKKAPTFTSNEISTIFKGLKKDVEARGFEGNKALVRLVGVALAYYGLCCSADLMNLQHEDVRKCEKKGNYYVLFEARVDTTNVRGAGNMATVKRKHTVKPFSFNLPMWLTPFLDTYMSLSPDNGNCLLCNPQKRVKAGGAVFVQNLGQNNLGKWGKELGLVLSKEKPDTYTTHCWRHSGATNLANNGGTELQLKRAGQ